MARILSSAATARLEGEDEGARGGGDSCGLTLLGPRILNHAELSAESPPLREHRRLLDPGVERVTRFVARTGVSSVIAAELAEENRQPKPGRLEIEMITLYALSAAVGIAVLWLGTNIKVIKQFERGVVFRFGRVQSGLRGPGLTMLIPIADRLEKVNMQIITMPVPSQDGITRDNVTVRVDAVIYFKVSDPVRAAVDVQDYVSAIGQVAQTSLRSIIGKSNLDDLLSNRERLNQGLELMIDSPALGWGVQIDRVDTGKVPAAHHLRRYYQGFGRPQACRQREQLQALRKLRAGSEAALEIDTDDAAEFAHLSRRERMLRMPRQAGVMNARNFRPRI